MKAMTAIDMNTSRIIKAADKAPVLPSSRVPASACGRLATIPANIISDIPLPMPRAVICSPNHIKKTVPPTSVITVVALKNKPGFVTAELPPLAIFSKPTDIPYACTAAKRTVRYLVY